MAVVTPPTVTEKVPVSVLATPAPAVKPLLSPFIDRLVTPGVPVVAAIPATLVCAVALSTAAHGTYQDSSSLPDYWPYGLFPNFRNTLWSCNWYDITGFAFTRYAVETFDTPVAVSDGYGDNIRFADRDPKALQQFFDLFEQRKQIG